MDISSARTDPPTALQSCFRFGMDVKVSSADVFKEDEEQVPRFLINFNNYTKVGWWFNIFKRFLFPAC